LLRKKYLVKLRAQVIELLFRVTEETLKKTGNSVTDITKDMTDTIVLLGGSARVAAKKTNLPLSAKTLFLDYR